MCGGGFTRRPWIPGTGTSARRGTRAAAVGWHALTSADELLPRLRPPPGDARAQGAPGRRLGCVLGTCAASTAVSTKRSHCLSSLRAAGGRQTLGKGLNCCGTKDGGDATGLSAPP